jgi:hypothetical protein
MDTHPAKLSRRQVMAARAISRKNAAREASAALDPSDLARYHAVKRLGLAWSARGLDENPNRGKRHAARMTDAFLQELAAAESKARAPLTVKTPLRTPTGRHSKRGGVPEYSQYIV